MAVNKIQIDAIQSRAIKGVATNQDCVDLIEYMSENYVDCEDFNDEIIQAIESSIESSISETNIIRAVQSSIGLLKNK